VRVPEPGRQALDKVDEGNMMWPGAARADNNLSGQNSLKLLSYYRAHFYTDDDIIPFRLA